MAVGLAVTVAHADEQEELPVKAKIRSHKMFLESKGSQLYVVRGKRRAPVPTEESLEFLQIADRKTKAGFVGRAEVGQAPGRSGRTQHWELTLKPKETRQFRISYQVEYPSELVLETRRKRMYETSSEVPHPSSPVRRQKYRIEEQLMDLEAQF